jgi:hypothetical protein
MFYRDCPFDGFIKIDANLADRAECPKCGSIRKVKPCVGGATYPRHTQPLDYIRGTKLAYYRWVNDKYKLIAAQPIKTK